MRNRSARSRGARPRTAQSTDSPLQIASAIADGAAPDIEPNSGDRLRDGLALIARIADRIGALCGRLESPSRQPALFQWCHLDVLELIGEGSHAQVYRAWDPLLAIEVALKLGHPDRAATVTQAWLDEARRMARLRHPNVVSVYGIDQENGRTGIWLELVRGESLQQRRLREGAPDLKEWCLAGIDLARGVGAIHRAGMVHGDIKPANLLRDADGRVLIADFGAAAMQSRAVRQGTPLTMAPEVLRGGVGTVASDLYSLGAVLFWLASGNWPREAGSLDELLAAHARPVDVTLPEHVPPALVRLLMSLLSSDPAQRPESAEAVEHALAGALHAAPHAGAAAMAAGATHAAHFSRMAGRDAELAYLQHEYERARNGHALPVLIEGESGSGKTFLLSHFGTWVEARGGRFLHVPLGADPATPRLAVALLRALMPLGEGGDDGSHDPVAAVERLLHRCAAPVLVLALDGLRHADEAERSFLRRVLASMPATVLVVGTVRTDAHRPAGDGGWFGDRPVGVLRLRPFAAEQMESILGVMLDLDDAGEVLPEDTCVELHRLSGGNPFYVSELLRHILLSHGGSADPSARWAVPARLPANLESLALDRCRRLPEETRKLLDTAAALGERIPLDWLAAASGMNADAFAAALQPALSAAVLDRTDDRFLRFRHGLIRQAWYEALDGGRRRERHAACMHATAFADDAEQQQLLAWHAGQAGESDLAFAAGYRAFVIHARAGQLDIDGLERLLYLLRHGARATGAQRWNTALAHARALRQRGRLADAQSALAQMRHAFRVRREGARHQQLLIEHSHVAFALGDHQQVLDDLQPMAALATGGTRPSAPRFREARLLTIRASTAKGDFVAAGALIAKALAERGYASDDHVALRTLQGWGMALLGRLPEAQRILAATLREVEPGRIETRADLLRRLAFVLAERGHYQAACHHAQQAHAAYRRVADAMGQAKCRLMLAEIRSAQGLHDEAMGYLKRVIPQLDEIGDRHCQAEAHWCLAQARRLRGETTLACSSIAQALQLINEVGDRDDEARFLIEFARIELAAGRPGEALGHARLAAAIGTELASDVTIALAAVEEAAALLAGAAIEQATALCTRAARTLRTAGAASAWRADWLLGHCAMACGAKEQAGAALASACAAIDRIVDELPRDDRGRRARLQAAWQPLIDDYAGVLEQCAHGARANTLRAHWHAIADGS